MKAIKKLNFNFQSWSFEATFLGSLSKRAQRCSCSGLKSTHRTRSTTSSSHFAFCLLLAARQENGRICIKLILNKICLNFIVFSHSEGFDAFGHFNADWKARNGKVNSECWNEGSKWAASNVRGVNCVNLTNVIIDGVVSSNSTMLCARRLLHLGVFI